MGRAEAVCVYMILVHSIMSTTRLVHRKTTPKLIPIPTQKGAEGSPLLEISVLYNSGDRDSGKPGLRETRILTPETGTPPNSEDRDSGKPE